MSNPVERRRRIEGVLESKQVYAADDAVMKKADRLYGQLASAGREIGMADTVICATALVYEEPVLTRNVEHVQRIDDLVFEPY